MNNISLALLDAGQSGVVTHIANTGSMRRRLMDLGLVNGTWVKCLHKSPSGSLSAYLIRGAVIALRRNDSDKISVHCLSKE